MRILGLIAATALVAGCEGRQGNAPPAGGNVNGNESGPAAETGEGNAVAPANAAAPASPASPAPAGAWDLQSSGEGTALVLPAAAGAGTAIRLFCPARQDRLLVNVPGFKPIGSEERLSFGSGGNAAALVADTRGDRQRGGVSGTGAVPDNLGALISGPISVSYGTQKSGPHPALPRELYRGFIAACQEGAAAARSPAPPPQGPGSKQPLAAGACMMQGTERLQLASLRAVGTEPFWAAQIEGRCVTYSHPEDQKGTRVWTRYTPGANGGGTWAGSLGGKPFHLRTRRQAGCSDGMSDRRYPMAVELLVAGERRNGCAHPL
jgi:uncharacterized membrane protein